MGRLQTLSESKNFVDQRVPEGAKLVLMGARKYSWDPQMKGTQMQVSLSKTSLIFVISCAETTTP